MKNKKQLQEIKGIFDKSNMEFFPCYGTLLGLIRDGDLIEWDADIDVCIFKEQFKNNGLLLLKSFEEEGWTLKSTIGAIEEGLIVTFKNKRYLDVHIIYSVGESLCGPFYGAGSRQGDMWELIWYKYPKFNLIKKEFDGVVLSIPDIAEKVISVHYGEDWREEKKSWSRSSQPRNMENTHKRHRLVKGIEQTRERYYELLG